MHAGHLQATSLASLAVLGGFALAIACGGSSSETPSAAGDAGLAEGGGTPPDGGGPAPGDADSSGPLDDGAAGDAPSSAAPVLPVLTNGAGGPVLTAPKVAYVFYPGYPFEADLKTFATKTAGSTYWATTTSEYGVGALTYAGTTELIGQTAPTTIKSTDLATWFTTELGKGTFGAPDQQTIYTVVCPQGTTITQPNPVLSALPDVVSCKDFGGYHDNAQLNGKDYAYAVIATCSGSVTGVTPTISHEWVEAATDPYLTTNGTFALQGGPHSAFFNVDEDHLVWAVMASGGEAGDLCQPEGAASFFTPPDLGYVVQRTWSNKSGAAGHDPCVPLVAGQAYFRSAPVLTESVVFHSFLTGNVKTKGITIPIGQTKTIDVVLYADGDPGGPWTVTADDLLYKYYGAASGGLLQNTLSFKWDKTDGKSGDTLHLSITVTAASALGNGHAFVITSHSGVHQTAWPGVIVDGP
jgi:hypothetical protein